MANPILTDKGFRRALRESDAGWAAPDAATTAPATTGATTPGAQPPGAVTGERVMTANGTFARAFVLFLLVLAAGAFGWSQVDVGTANQIDLPTWSFFALGGGLVAALVCIFVPRSTPFVAPVYAVLEGLFLGVLSKAFETMWDGIVLQAILVTLGVFFVTLALYVLGIVKVTRRFQMVVIGATLGVFVMYVFGALMSLFGADVMFWNEPSALGIIVSVVIACVAALNLFLDYEFIRQASLARAPKYMEWYGGFGLMITLVWLYLEVLRLLSLLRQ